jgi:uncharacterized protein VirK/YbjX
MKSLWRHLARLFVREQAAEGYVNAALMLAGATRAVLFHRQHRQLLRLEIVDKYITDVDDSDALFHLSHRHYLSKSFDKGKRVECALAHYSYENECHDDVYKDAVYRDGGMLLWSCTAGATVYALKLIATELRHEGGVSVVLLADDVALCEMSYAWVEAGMLGLGRGTLPLITRNQSIGRSAAPLARFRADFPQNSPPYFCLAAVHAIAQLHGFDRLAGIRSECQIAFEERYASSFSNSYCRFWTTFAGTEVGSVAYAMPVPLSAPPLASVKSKYRKRAMLRRRQWAKISHDAQQALAPRLRRQAIDIAHLGGLCPAQGQAPPPISARAPIPSA